jgi:hypothetical protein
MPEPLKCKPQDKSARQPRPEKQQKLTKDMPCTSSHTPQATHQQNLTLADWLSIFAFIDTHPMVTQTDVVRHFTTLESGKLIFD